MTDLTGRNSLKLLKTSWGKVRAVEWCLPIHLQPTRARSISPLTSFLHVSLRSLTERPSDSVGPAPSSAEGNRRTRTHSHLLHNRKITCQQGDCLFLTCSTMLTEAYLCSRRRSLRATGVSCDGSSSSVSHHTRRTSTLPVGSGEHSLEQGYRDIIPSPRTGTGS